MMNEELYKEIKANWDNLAKPLDSMGVFEDILSRIGAIREDVSIDISPAALAVLIADNGIIKEGVSQSDETVTRNVAKAIGEGKSSVCHMARAAGIRIYPYNIGMKLPGGIPGIDDRFFVADGTRSFVDAPALIHADLTKAIENGRQIARDIYNDGNKIILLGEMGIGNTTTSTAVIASLLHLPAEAICGRGAGLSDDGFECKKNVISRAIDKYDLINADAMKILETVGGFDIAAMVGIILESQALGVPVIIDGLITAAAALVALRLCPSTRDIVFFSHKGREKGIMTVADCFGQIPVIDASLALGEGTGAVLFYTLLTNVTTLYHGGTKFADMEIEKYQRYK